MPAFPLDNCGNNLHDRLGSVRILIDTAGNVLRSYTYGPFGEVLEEFAEDDPAAPSNSLMFTGQWFDSEIDQYYLRARMYDPHIGRFTSRDPVTGKFEEPLTLHKYLYCINDPMNRIDPWGWDSVALYSYLDKGTGARRESANDYDWWLPVGNLEDAISWTEFLKILGVDIDDLYIFGHGTQGFQLVGDEPLFAYSPQWLQLSATLAEEGTVHLRGCKIARGYEGKNYIMNLANFGQVKVSAFDDDLIHFGYERWGADYWSAGNLYLAEPNAGYRLISEGSWLSEFFRGGRR